MTETGKRIRGLKRLSWANLLAAILTLAALIPLLTTAYGSVASYVRLRADSDTHTQDIKTIQRDLKAEIKERQSGQKEMSDLQHTMDGKLDILIRRRQ